jgi:hypothetical protein
MDLLLEFLKKPKKYQEKMKLPFQHFKTHLYFTTLFPILFRFI